jgi:hypothetical protein
MTCKSYSHYIVSLLLLFIIRAQDFSDGPYGINFFDIAGPFTIEDLGVRQSGDLDGDRFINLKDVLLYTSYLDGEISFSEEELIYADINEDSNIDIIDIILSIDKIFNFSPALWSFEDSWIGGESYILIPSNTLWQQNVKLELLQNSPLNVHYIFLSNLDSNYDAMLDLKAEFDIIINQLSSELKTHWLSHLHFSAKKISEYDSWLSEGLANRQALGINQFQLLQETGSLSNPDGFIGNYLHYLAHEALFYDYEWNVLNEDESTYDEITVFERAHYTGGWASTIETIVEFPDVETLDNYSGMSIELLRGCPDANGNYSDQGCDDYDRIARMFICNEDGSNCNEAARWITPFDRQPHHLTDISPFISMIKSGGNKMVKFQESGWPNSLLTMRFRFYHGEDLTDTPQTFQPMWVGTIPFNPDFDDNTPPIVFEVPDDATKVEFVSYITGHGWGCDGFNCAEFCNSKHIFTVNGGVHEFETAYPEADDNNYCMELETIIEGVVPNQWGTWGYGRAGWCPGQDVHPVITDITDYISTGEENVMQYSACRESWNGCVDPPVCPPNDCYCPEIAVSSYIIIWR